MYAAPALALAMLLGVGCKSSYEPGVKSTYRSQSIMVAADTMTTTSAAHDVFMGEKLLEVSDAKSTAVDGKVTAKKADGTVITAKVVKETDTTSSISVNVGTLGDPELGADYAKKIKMAAEKAKM